MNSSMKNSAIEARQSSSRRVPQFSSVSITEGTIWKAILSFFFPILFGTFFQQLYNTVDAIVIGRFVGKEALAAVGGGVAVYVNLLVGFFVGLSSGASVVISQFYGAKNDADTSNSVHTSMAMALFGGILLTAVGLLTASLAMRLIGTPDEILVFSETYLKIYFWGMVPLFVYNMGASILRAVGDSKTPLAVLIAGCLLNIALDIIFVRIFGWGIAGAAWATVASELLSMVLVCIFLMKSEESYRLNPLKINFTPHIFKKMLKIGFPSGLQSSMYTISNILIQASINSFGTIAIASWAAYGKIDVLFWMIVNAFGVSVTTFAGQNYGAKKYERIHKGVRVTLFMTAFVTVLISVLFCAFGEMVFAIFTTDSDVVREGMVMLRFLAPTYITFISVEILSGTIRGCGSSFVPMLISLVGVCALRVLWISIAVPRRHEFFMVELSYPITWSTTSVLFWFYYLFGKWLKKK